MRKGEPDGEEEDLLNLLLVLMVLRSTNEASYDRLNQYKQIGATKIIVETLVPTR